MEISDFKTLNFLCFATLLSCTIIVEAQYDILDDYYSRSAERDSPDEYDSRSTQSDSQSYEYKLRLNEFDWICV